MIIAYVWKNNMGTWTTAYWDRIKRKYDITVVKAQSEAFQWLKRQVPGYRLLDVREFLKITSIDIPPNVVEEF